MTNKPPATEDNVQMTEPTTSSTKTNSLPFMDTFYALSSDDPYERSLAASALLRHLFSKGNFKQKSSKNDDTNNTNNNNNNDRKVALIQDGHYAFTRLLKGLCSGRAGARQGYASCLATFLELSCTLCPIGDDDDTKETTATTKCWMEYYMENESASGGGGGRADVSPCEFVRKQLMKHTVESAPVDNKGGKRKGSGGAEERDRMYGKLFGILAVVKSGTLFRSKSSVTNKLIKQYMLDLITLYHHKKWFHEAAIHALLQLTSAISQHTGLETLTTLINTVLPSFFHGTHSTWTAEQIALYLHLQTIYMNADKVLPKTVRSPLLTCAALACDTDGSIVEALRITSEVVAPRCHLVWGVIWSYLTIPTSSDNSDSPQDAKQQDIPNTLRDELITGKQSPKDILKSLISGVILVSLLATTPEELSSTSDADAEMSTASIPPNKSTNERKSLALTLIHQLCCKLHLSGEVLEHIVLQPLIVTKLFVNSLLCTTSNKKKNIMGPLATMVLDDIVDCVTEENGVVDRRLGVVKALVKANPELDTVCHTDSIALVLGLKKTNTDDDDNADVGAVEDGKKMDELWESYLSFLKGLILTRNSSPETTKKYIGLLFSLANHVFRLKSTKPRDTMFRSVLSFLMVGGFFDLTKLSPREDQMDDEENVFLGVAGVIQKQLLTKGDTRPAFPYVVRVSMSSRFFSLLSEAIAATPAQHLMDRGQALRDFNMKYNLELFEFVRMGWDALETNGALPFERSRSDEEFSIGNTRKEGDRMVRLLGTTVDGAEDGEKTMNERAISGIVCLATALIIQLLNPGSPDSSEANEWEALDDEESDTAEEVQELVSELSLIAETLNVNEPVVNPDDDDDSNKLASLAAVCVEILSRKLNSNAKLMRFLTKTAWTGCLAMTNEKVSADAFILDKDVMNVLLPSVCGSAFISPEDENDSDSDTMEEADDDDEVFGFSDNATAMDLDKVCNSSDENEVKSEAGDDQSEEEEEEEEEDVQLDPSALENLLLEDSDGEEVELEHHAGADSALAQLIKMKQDARKAGKDQQEKIEGVHKLRCMVLLEAVFGYTPSQQIVMMSIRPLLRARRELDKSIESITASGKKKGVSSLSEKCALLKQISALLREKITKQDVAEAEDCHSLASELMDDLKKCTSESHRTCCNALLIMMLKAQNFDESTSLGREIFTGTVEEWSTRRATKIHSSIFVDLIRKNPCLSRVILLTPLATAAKNARSSFLKLESFRMISSLYTLPAKASSEENSAEISAMAKSIPETSAAIAAALSNKEFSKANKARDVLKTAEKIVAYGVNHGNSELWSHLAAMKESIHVLSNKSESAGVKNVCAKLQKDISEGISAIAKKDDISKTPLSKKTKKKKKVKKQNKN